MKHGDLPWTTIREVLETGTPVVAILPLGAVEAHGPHLPLCTDVIISEGMATRAASILEAQGVRTLLLPALAYAPAEYASAFPGTISIGSDTAMAVLLDIAHSLKAQGFACLALANSHFDPANVTMLRAVVSKISTPEFPIVFPDFTRRTLAAGLTEEFKSGACHAGQFETSLVLADRPDLVDTARAQGLADNPASLVDAFARGARTFAEAGGHAAYFGSPRQATAREGAETSTIMAEAIAAAITASLAARPAPR